MWELDYKENWVSKNWCFWTVVLEKTLESPLDCKEIKPVIPKGNHSWIFIGRTDAEVETPLLWPPDAKSWLIGINPDAGKGGGGDVRGWGGCMASLTRWTWVWASSGSWWWTGKPSVLQSMGSQESDMTDWLNWTDCTIFLDSTYLWKCTIFVFFWFTSLIMTDCRSFHTSRNDYFVPFSGWGIFHCIYVPHHLSPSFV